MIPEISVILPTYNEYDNIISLIERIRRCLPNNIEIIVVDDNSPDGTSSLVSSRYANNMKIRLILRENERGLTSAIQRGIDEATGDIIVWMDCDLSMPPEKIPDLVEPIKRQDYDVVVGSRYVRGGKDRRTYSKKAILWFHTILSRILTLLTAFILWPGFYDWTSGFIAVRADLIKSIRLSGDYGEYFIKLMYTLLINGYRVLETPYQLIPRRFGESKTATNLAGFFKRGIKYLLVVFQVRFLE